MPPKLMKQRTLALEASAPKPRPPQSQKGRPSPAKGKPTGAKASYTRKQYDAIRASFTGVHAERNRLWFTLDTFLGARVTELADLRWSDLLHPDGTVRDSVYWSSWRQKGGWGKSPDYVRPLPKDPGHVEGCACYICQVRRGERQPKAYRPPAPREIPIPWELHAELLAYQASVAASARGWHYDDFVFQSRKRAKDGGSRPISRQQVHYALKAALRLAHMGDVAFLGIEKYATHSMRRTAINRVYEHTKDMGRAAKFANHKNQATTSIYIESDPRLLAEDVRNASTKWLAA